MDIFSIAHRIAARGTPTSDITPDQVWNEAQAYHAKNGRWPTRSTAERLLDFDMTWITVDRKFNQGTMGLPNIKSLSKFLISKGVDRPAHLDRSYLTEEYILDLVKKHKERTGRYPTKGMTDPIPGENGLTWENIDKRLERGTFGLTKYDSLADLREQHEMFETDFIPGVYQGYENDHYFAHFNEEYLVGLLNEFYAEHGYYPSVVESKPVPFEPNITWKNIDKMLQRGRREFPLGGSLSKFRTEHGMLINKPMTDVKDRKDRSYLDEDYIVGLIKKHKDRTGRYPSNNVMEPIPDEFGLTWGDINKRLVAGTGPLPGGSSLAKLKEKHGFYNDEGQKSEAPDSTTESDPTSVSRTDVIPENAVETTDNDIWELAQKYCEIHGEYPTKYSTEAVPGRPELTWNKINNSYIYGRKDLSPEFKSLAQMLRSHGVEVFTPVDRSDLTVEKLKSLVENHYQTYESYPSAISDAPIEGEEGLTWKVVDGILKRGYHGFPKGGSLAKFKVEHGYTDSLRAQNNGAPQRYPYLTGDMVWEAAKTYKDQTGKWPSQISKDPVPGYDGLIWSVVNSFFVANRSGLPPEHNSLPKFLRSRGADIKERVDRSYLNEDYIKRLIIAYKIANGNYPGSSTSEPIPGENGLTWKAIDAILSRGLNGFPRGGSLTKFKAKHGFV